MTSRHFTKTLVFATCVGLTAAVLGQSQDRFTLTASNGIAFSEFKGYEMWPLIATSQHDGDDGCGTATHGCAKAILGNPIMIQAYQDGFPANGKPVPDGAVMAKVEWLKATDEAAPYQITVPGLQTEVAFMVKDSRRFTATNGWGYATFQYDATSRTYKLHARQKNPSFAFACHSCHTAGAKATDFVYTAWAQR